MHALLMHFRAAFYSNSTVNPAVLFARETLIPERMSVSQSVTQHNKIKFALIEITFITHSLQRRRRRRGFSVAKRKI